MWKGESLSLVLDVCRSPVNMEILRILANSDRGSYPSQLARRLGKDRTLVNRKLRKLHDLGLVRRVYEVRGSKGVMVYRANQRNISVTIDFKKGKASVTKSLLEDRRMTLDKRVLIGMFPNPSPDLTSDVVGNAAM